MKKRTKENILIGAGLVLLSLLLHYFHYLIFKDIHHTLIFLAADIAFIPMEVFFTTIVLDGFLERREKEHFLEKLNMLVGVFYTEIGGRILQEFVMASNPIKECKEISSIEDSMWNENFPKALEKLKASCQYKVDLNKINIRELKEELHESKDLLITFITNESLHDHETFTDMIMSLLHLKEEIDSRCCLEIEEYEKTHIESDMAVAYRYLTIEWCEYMSYLNKNYPNLFIKALINNPFDTRDKKIKDAVFLNFFNS